MSGIKSNIKDLGSSFRKFVNMNKQTTTIVPKTDLYNKGKCFTKGKEYVIERRINTRASLMDITIINDLGEEHRIGSWWREFDIVEPETEND